MQVMAEKIHLKMCKQICKFPFLHAVSTLLSQKLRVDSVQHFQLSFYFIFLHTWFLGVHKYKNNH